MNTKVLMPHFIFWFFFLLLLLFGVSFCNSCSKNQKEDNLSTQSTKTESIGNSNKMIVIDTISFIETYNLGGVTVYSINGYIDSLDMNLQEIRKQLEVYDCFFYNQGNEDQDSFIFAGHHIIKCEMVDKEKKDYRRNIILKGPWKQKISKRNAYKFLDMIKEGRCEASKVCGERCCRPPKKD